MITGYACELYHLAMPLELYMPLALRFLNSTKNGDWIQLDLLDVDQGVPFLKITHPLGLRGTSFTSFEDANLWLCGSERIGDWHYAPSSEVLKNFATFIPGKTEFCSLNYLLGELKAKLIRTPNGKEKAGRVQASSKQAAKTEASESNVDAVNSDYIHASVASAAGFNDSFEYMATRIVANQMLSYVADKQQAPFASALRTPGSGFDLFMLKQLGSDGVTCLLDIEDSTRGKEAYVNAWQTLSINEKSEFMEQFERRYSIPETCTIPSLLTSLQRWYTHASACARDCMVDLSLPSENAMCNSAPRWHHEGWVDVIRWARKKPWSCQNFSEMIRCLHNKYSHAVMYGSWVAIYYTAKRHTVSKSEQRKRKRV